MVRKNSRIGQTDSPARIFPPARAHAPSGPSLQQIPLLLLTIEQAARALSISPRTLQALSANGEIPVVRVARRCIRYSPDDLQRWVESQKQQSGTTEIIHEVDHGRRPDPEV